MGKRHEKKVTKKRDPGKEAVLAKPRIWDIYFLDIKEKKSFSFFASKILQSSLFSITEL